MYQTLTREFFTPLLTLHDRLTPISCRRSFMPLNEGIVMAARQRGFNSSSRSDAICQVMPYGLWFISKRLNGQIKQWSCDRRHLCTELPNLEFQIYSLWSHFYSIILLFGGQQQFVKGRGIVADTPIVNKINNMFDLFSDFEITSNIYPLQNINFLKKNMIFINLLPFCGRWKLHNLTASYTRVGLKSTQNKIISRGASYKRSCEVIFCTP